MLKKKLAVPMTALALVLSAGGMAAAAHADTAATSTSTDATTSSSTTASTHAFDPSKGGHVGKNGTEVLLTGDTADKVTAAALAAVPGGTIQRVETDADGAVYEAHMTKSDGTSVTVTFDANYAVVETQTGGPGGHGPQGQAPADTTSTTSS